MPFLYPSFQNNSRPKFRLLLALLCLSCLPARAQSLPGSGNTLAFNGFNTYVSCGTSNRGISQQVTAEAWIKTTSSAYQWVAAKYFNSLLEEKGFHLYVTGGTAGFNGRIGIGQYMTSGPSTTRIDDGRWHHLAGVCNFSTWQIYVDGVLESTGTYPSSSSDLTTSTALVIGSYDVQAGQFFNGEIDEVRLWRTARSQAEIRDNMCRKFTTAPADLVAYYRFDQAAAGTAADAGSQPSPGILRNFPGVVPWRTSGAPLGDASTSLYLSAWPAGSQVSVATLAGDVATAQTIASTVRGIQIYAVNSAPSIAPPGGAAPAYFGVFTAGGSAAANGYSLLLRPAAGPACRNAYTRGRNDQAWTLSAQLPISGPALLAQNLTYRSEHILTPPVATAAAITGDSVLCAGARTQLSVVAPGSVGVVWNTGATTSTLSNLGPGTYTATVSFGPTCFRTLRRTVSTAVAPSVSILGDSALCPGGSTTLTAAASGATAFRWSTGALTPAVTVSQPGSYTVTISYGTGCTTTTRRTVRIAPTPVVTISGDSTVCPGRSTTLTASLPGATAFRWSTGATTAALSVSQPGLYSVVVSYGQGCTSTARREVRAGVAVPAFTLGADTTLCEGEQLVLQGPVGVNLRYLWSDNSISRQLTVQTTGRYTLRVLSDNCGEQTASRSVTVRSCLLVPNIITVNADGLNDVFEVQGLRGQGWTLEVYNRWGRTVLQAADYHNDWGRDAAPGLYYVVLRRPATGYLYKGWLEVVR